MDELSGIFSNSDPNAAYDGGLGDGADPTTDVLSTILNSQAVSTAAAVGVSALLGGQKVIVNNATSSGTFQPITGAQAGAIGAQNTTTNPLAAIPTYGWILGGVILLIGAAVLLWPSKKSKD